MSGLLRAQHVFVGGRLVADLGLGQDVVDHLVFQHHGFHLLQLLLVAVVPVHHLGGGLVALGDLFDQGLDAGTVDLEVSRLDDLADEQAQGHLAPGLFGEELVRQHAGVDVLGVAAELAQHVLALAADFVGNHGLGNFQGVHREQAVECLALGLVLDSLLELALHVLAHVDTEFLEVAAGNAEGLDEFGVHFRQHRRLDLVDLDLEHRRLALQVLGLVVGREGHVQAALFAGLGAHQLVFEAGDHALGADHEAETLGGTALKGLAVDRAVEVQVQAVAVFGGFRAVGPGRTLAAQGVDHLLDVGVGHGGHRALDLHAGQAGQLYFREYLEAGHEGNVGLAFVLDGLNGREAGRIQLFLSHGFIEAVTDQVTQGFLADAGTEALLHHGQRHLAGAEAVHAHGTGGLVDAVVDLAVHSGCRHGNGHAAFKGRRGLNRNLHSILYMSDRETWLPVGRALAAALMKGGGL